MMVRALEFVCVAIMAQCNASMTFGEYIGWTRPLHAHYVEYALLWTPKIVSHGWGEYMAVVESNGAVKHARVV